jgi:hypothetical protein
MGNIIKEEQKMVTIFRELKEGEEKEFRDWARKNYTKYSEIKGIWHPVVQDECVKINSED